MLLNSLLDCCQASLLPEAVDNAWSSVGGGPSDLTFPEQFLGTWKVQNTLVKVETPLGPDYVPDMKVQQPATWSHSQCVCTLLNGHVLTGW